MSIFFVLMDLQRLLEFFQVNFFKAISYPTVDFVVVEVVVVVDTSNCVVLNFVVDVDFVVFDAWVTSLVFDVDCCVVVVTGGNKASKIGSGIVVGFVDDCVIVGVPSEENKSSNRGITIVDFVDVDILVESGVPANEIISWNHWGMESVDFVAVVVIDDCVVFGISSTEKWGSVSVDSVSFEDSVFFIWDDVVVDFVVVENLVVVNVCSFVVDDVVAVENSIVLGVVDICVCLVVDFVDLGKCLVVDFAVADDAVDFGCCSVVDFVVTEDCVVIWVVNVSGCVVVDFSVVVEFVVIEDCVNPLVVDVSCCVTVDFFVISDVFSCDCVVTFAVVCIVVVCDVVFWLVVFCFWLVDFVVIEDSVVWGFVVVDFVLPIASVIIDGLSEDSVVSEIVVFWGFTIGNFVFNIFNSDSVGGSPSLQHHTSCVTRLQIWFWNCIFKALCLWSSLCSTLICAIILSLQAHVLKLWHLQEVSGSKVCWLDGSSIFLNFCHWIFCLWAERKKYGVIKYIHSTEKF